MICKENTKFRKTFIVADLVSLNAHRVTKTDFGETPLCANEAQIPCAKE